MKGPYRHLFHPTHASATVLLCWRWCAEGENSQHGCSLWHDIHWIFNFLVDRSLYYNYLQHHIISLHEADRFHMHDWSCEVCELANWLRGQIHLHLGTLTLCSVVDFKNCLLTLQLRRPQHCSALLPYLWQWTMKLPMCNCMYPHEDMAKQENRIMNGKWTDPSDSLPEGHQIFWVNICKLFEVD